MKRGSNGKFSASKGPILSIVVPAFNEAEGIQTTLIEIIRNIPSELSKNYEILVVDDGSTDPTISEVIQMIRTNSRIRLIKMRGNQGHMAALTAGMSAANGEWILTMDADLQDPPELIGPMMAIAKQGDCEVVQAVRSSRESDTFFKRLTSNLFYRWMRYLVGSKAINQGADFRLINRSVRDEIVNLPEKSKVYRLLIPHLGFRIETISFARRERTFGKTKYPLKKMIGLAIDSTISFSSKPLRSLTLIGGSLSVFMVVMSIFTAIAQFFIPTVSGWTSIVCLVLSGNALILASIGLLGEYISKIFIQVQNRPSEVWSEISPKDIYQTEYFDVIDGKVSDKNKTFQLNSYASNTWMFFTGVFGILICIWSFHWGYLSPFSWQWAENSQPGLLDVATSVAAQQDFFRSSWSFPIGLVHNYGYPVGTSLIQTATALIPTVGLKILASLFGITVPIQSAGITILIGYFLLGVTLYKLFRFEGLPSHLALLGTLPFFFIPKVFNNWAQPSLSWVWLIPFSIYLYRTSLVKSKILRVIAWGSLGLISSSTHTYFLIPIVLIAIFMFLEMYLTNGNARDETHVLSSLFVGSVFGTWLVGGLNIGAGGTATDPSQVGPYATDLLGLFSTYGQSRFLPTISHLPSFEGQAYLGLGLLTSLFLAAIISLKVLIKNYLRKTSIDSEEGKESGVLRIRGLVFSAFILTLLAVGPTFTVAGKGHPLELPHKVLMLFSIFRASGRFIWLGMFIVGIYSIVYLYKNIAPKKFQLLLLSILIIQIGDTYPALNTTRQYVSIVVDPSQARTPYIPGSDIYFLPGYPDPVSTPWRGQVFKTLQNGSKVYYFAYQGRYSPSKIGNSVVESLTLVQKPNFKSESVVFVRSDFLIEFLSNLKLRSYPYDLTKVDSLWTAVRIS